MSGAVFLSYASQDTEAARRICEALRSAGVEVWFDQEGGLEHGDAWDGKIRGQIKECLLFLPLISAHTQARHEGYFRVEWELAAERAVGIAQGVAFILPVVIDDTREPDALVPDRFRKVQWTRLPGGVVSPEAQGRLLKLWSHRLGLLSHGAATGAFPALAQAGLVGGRRVKGLALIAAALVCIGIGLAWWGLNHRASSQGGTLRSGESPGVPLSEARQLAGRAKAMTLDNYDSGPDDFAAADGLIKRALELDSNDAEIWAISSQLNTAFASRGFDFSPARGEAARSQAERALKLAPDSIEGLYALARWQRDHDPDHTVAEKTFKAVLARAPDHAGALGSLGSLYDRSDRFKDAIAIEERFAQQPAWLALARYEEYLTYFRRSYFAEAERCVRESIAATPSANSVTGLAMVLLTAKGNARAAVEALAAIPAASRDEHRAIWISAYTHLAAHKPEEALRDMDRLSADSIQDNWFVGPKAYWIGRAHVQAGRPEAARLAFESGLQVTEEKLKVARDDAWLHGMHGELLAWLGRSDEALREARTQAELNRGRDYWFSSPARIYAVLGRADDALPLLKSLCQPVGQPVGWPLTPALLRIDPLWDKVRGDPRFAALLTEPPAPEAKN